MQVPNVISPAAYKLTLIKSAALGSNWIQAASSTISCLSAENTAWARNLTHYIPPPYGSEAGYAHVFRLTLIKSAASGSNWLQATSSTILCLSAENTARAQILTHYISSPSYGSDAGYAHVFRLTLIKSAASGSNWLQAASSTISCLSAENTACNWIKVTQDLHLHNIVDGGQ